MTLPPSVKFALLFETDHDASKTEMRLDFLALAILMVLMAFGAFSGLGLIALSLIVVTSLVFEFIQPLSSSQKPINALILLLFQNLIIGIFSHYGLGKTDQLMYLTQAPAAYIFISGFFGLWQTKERRLSQFSFFFISLLIIIFFLSKAPIVARAVYLRNFSLVFFGVGLFSRHLGPKENQYRFLRQFICLSIVALLFGLLTYVQKYSLWRALGVDEVYIAKGDVTSLGTFNGRFYTSLISRSFFRMAGLYYEPVNMGYFFAAAILVGILFPFSTRPWKIGYIASMGIGLVLTFGKGAWLFFALLIGLWLAASIVIKLFEVKEKKLIARSLAIVFSMGLLAGIVFATWYSVHIGGAASPHFWAISQTWETIKGTPFGIGLGMGGNLSGKADYSTGAESGFFSLMVQTGIPFTVLYSTFYIILAARTDYRAGPKFLFFIPLALLFASVFQENTFTPQCMVPVLSLCFIEKPNYEKTVKLLSGLDLI